LSERTARPPLLSSDRYQEPAMQLASYAPLRLVSGLPQDPCCMLLASLTAGTPLPQHRNTAIVQVTMRAR